MVTQWRDKKDVSMMSASVTDGTVIVKRAGKDKKIFHVLLTSATSIWGELKKVIRF